MKLVGIIILPILLFVALLLFYKFIIRKNKSQNGSTSISPSVSASTLSIDSPSRENDTLISPKSNNSGSTLSINSPIVSPVPPVSPVSPNKVSISSLSTLPVVSSSTLITPSTSPVGSPAILPVEPSSTLPVGLPATLPVGSPATLPVESLDGSTKESSDNSNQSTNVLSIQPTQSEIEDKAWNNYKIDENENYAEYENWANMYHLNDFMPIKDTIADLLLSKNILKDKQVEFLVSIYRIKEELLQASSRNDKLKIIENITGLNEWSFLDNYGNEIAKNNLDKFFIVLEKIKETISTNTNISDEISSNTNLQLLRTQLLNFTTYLNDAFRNQAYNKETFNKLVEGESLKARPVLTILRLFFTTCYECNYSINNLPINSNECLLWYKKYVEIQRKIEILEPLLINNTLEDKLNNILSRIDENFKKIFTDVTEVEFDYAYKTVAIQIKEKIEKNKLLGEAETENYNILRDKDIPELSGGSVKSEKSNDIKYIIILLVLIFGLSIFRR